MGFCLLLGEDFGGLGESIGDGNGVLFFSFCAVLTFPFVLGVPRLDLADPAVALRLKRL